MSSRLSSRLSSSREAKLGRNGLAYLDAPAQDQMPRLVQANPHLLTQEEKMGGGSSRE